MTLTKNPANSIRPDRSVNLVFEKTTHNFNPDVAAAGRITIAQVEEIVEHIDPIHVQVPGIYVDRVVHVEPQQTGIENRTLTQMINVGKETITAAEGASFFSCSASFGMIRSRAIHLDNWDLVHGAKR